ncbi:MAG: NAD(P)/FAD-dependent oxidoreductase [Pseudomonadota bacterium]
MKVESDKGFHLAVIGAGIAGLACAHEVQAAGGHVTVFEKSRGTGGRLATRYRGALRFDHGAQYVTARSPGFRQLVDRATCAGAAAVWSPQGLPVLEDWYVGCPGMSQLVQPLADHLQVHLQTAVAQLEPAGTQWRLLDAQGGALGCFDQVVAAIPAPQARAVLQPHSPLFDAAADSMLSPCMTALVAFEETIREGQDVICDREAAVTWAARNGSKPQRPTGPDCWVLQAGAEWSQSFLEATPEKRAEALLEQWQWQLGGTLPEPCHLESHSWLYARVETPLSAPFLLDTDKGLSACGDWCLGARAEAAWDSGRQLGHMLAAFA